MKREERCERKGEQPRQPETSHRPVRGRSRLKILQTLPQSAIEYEIEVDIDIGEVVIDAVEPEGGRWRASQETEARGGRAAFCRPLTILSNIRLSCPDVSENTKPSVSLMHLSACLKDAEQRQTDRIILEKDIFSKNMKNKLTETIKLTV
ncbi:hypothetical protein ALC56_07473 [Trachymyrmex septentrionalis]|uniref:Uncharacterized protein n=1 Tax=Trachymyrmex septentrionalis TaxID=34720 RepID=A0A151JVU0_9HYME|nr:hypothetical protein ALC56_07473 [Trachymyrmex septentrionalis]